MRKGLIIFAVVVVVVGVLAWAKLFPSPGGNESLYFPVDKDYRGWVGKPAVLDFVSLDGRRVTSAELRGKVVLLDFWATWCGPCMQSLGHLKNIYAQFHDKGLEVVAINFDDNRAAVEAVLRSEQLPWPQYFEGRDNSLGRKFGITHYPSMWLLDRAGNVRYISALADTETKINILLAESEAQAAAFAAKANSGILGRLKLGFAALRSSDSPNSEDMKIAAAPTKTESSATPRGIPELDGKLKVESVILSAKPSVVIKSAGVSRYLNVGDTIVVTGTSGRFELRCESILISGVTLKDTRSGAVVELKLN